MSTDKNRGWIRSPLLLIIIFLSIFSCNNNDDDALRLPEEIRTVNEFIWEKMNTFYLWKDYMPTNVDPDKETDPKAFFEKLLYRPEDRWSFITDDYQALTDMLKGIEVTFGHHFQLFRVPDSDGIVGIVQYVTKNSPADQAGIQRGDLFYKVDGTILNTDNYRELLFNRQSYVLSFGSYVDGEIVDAGRDVSLTAVKMQENPIIKKTVLDVEGKKIGYLVYTQFLPDYTDSLRAALGAFRQSGISDLVLDLRYNPGGVITNARDLSSMIVPQPVMAGQKVFAKFIWNDLLTDYFLEKEGENSENLVLTFNVSEVNLDLQKIYVLVSSATASASELVINGLKPYMDVILVGPDHTNGKYTGSITLSDQEKHNWAIQPIVLKSANANGITDYRNGFMPDYIAKDNLYLPLGDPDEDMLAKVIELITGTVARKSVQKETAFPGIPLFSGSNRPINEMQRMWWNHTIPVRYMNKRSKSYIENSSY